MFIQILCTVTHGRILEVQTNIMSFSFFCQVFFFLSPSRGRLFPLSTGTEHHKDAIQVTRATLVAQGKCEWIAIVCPQRRERETCVWGRHRALRMVYFSTDQSPPGCSFDTADVWIQQRRAIGVGLDSLGEWCLSKPWWTTWWPVPQIQSSVGLTLYLFINWATCVLFLFVFFICLLFLSFLLNVEQVDNHCIRLYHIPSSYTICIVLYQIILYYIRA